MEPTGKSIAEIASGLRFTLEELALNRTGHISAHQLWESTKMALTFGGLVVTIVGMGLSTFLMVKPTGLVRVICAIMIPGSLVIFSFFAWPVVVGAVTRRVLTAEGSLAFTSGYRSSAIMLVGKYRGTRDRAPEILTPGVVYRVYYLDRSDLFLSIEPVPAATDLESR